MGELANYSIETDHLIWLSFKDGHSVRVPVGLLPNYLSPRDLQKVRRAIKLRRDFFRHNMPPTLLILFAVGLLTVVAAGTQTVALLMRRSAPYMPVIPHTEIVRNTGIPTHATLPDPSPPASPAATPAATPVATAPKPPATTSRAKPSAESTKPAVAARLSTPKPVANTSNVLTPEPVVSPEPTPTPSPQPSPTPTPPAPQAGPGQVLGDSTGPETAPESVTPIIP
jgi:hypothetical protein